MQLVPATKSFALVIYLPHECIFRYERRRKCLFTSLSTAKVISRQDRNLEQVRDFLFESFSCIRIIKTALNNAAHLYSDQANPLIVISFLAMMKTKTNQSVVLNIELIL